ncbi:MULTISPECIES: hypothetical protein [Streptomycetaceae]|nr:MULTISPECIES: hypothetical protein [Streptomycetaceae]
MHTTSTGAAATAWTLPDGYKPAGPQRIPVVIAVSSTITAGMATTTVSITPTPPASADVHFNVFMQ